MVKKKIIGVDLDEVLMDAITPTCRFVNDHYGTAFSREKILVHDFAKAWGCSTEEAIARMERFYASDYHDEGLPIEGACETIQKLKDTHELHVVTARPGSTKEKTLQWLEKHFPETFKSVSFTKHYFNHTEKVKSDICKELGVDAFIDDAPHNTEDVANVVSDVFLLHAPWNKKYTPSYKNIHRVHSWDEIYEKLMKL